MNAINFKRALGRELKEIMRKEKLTTLDMAKRMHTSVTVVNRVLDPLYLFLPITTMELAFFVTGKQLELKIS